MTEDVTSLHNSKKTDAQIQQDVLDELKWDTRVEPNDVGVEVHSGVVTLTGTVSSWAKKVAAEEAAHRVSGVLDVANDMIVKIPSSIERDDTQIAAAVREALKWDVFVPDDRIQSTVTGRFSSRSRARSIPARSATTRLAPSETCRESAAS